MLQAFAVLLSLLSLLNQAPPALAQSPPIVTREGQRFYLHKVTQGESLYTVAKLYKVPELEIAQANPSSFLSIFIGQELLVPLPPSAGPEVRGGMIQHVVEPGQTLMAISRQYEVDINQILHFNPQAIDGIRAGQTLRVPTPEAQAELDPQTDVLIPGDLESVVAYLEQPCDRFSLREFDRPFRVALLLPLQIERNQWIQWENASQADQVSLHSNSENFLMFYEGFLLALDTLRREGVRLEVLVKDTENSSDRVRSILQDPAMAQQDLIMGPVFPEQMALVSQFARQNQITMVSPLATDQAMLEGNPYFFQANSSTATRARAVAEYVRHFERRNVLVVHNGQEAELVQEFERELSRVIPGDSLSGRFTTVNYYQDGGALGRSLARDRQNIIIIPSGSEVFISSILQRLNVMVADGRHNITVFGTPSWERFENMEIEFYQNLNIHFYTSTHVDYQKRLTRDFVGKYRRFFKTEPSQYSFQGYDLGWCFVNALKSFGPAFRFCLPSQSSDWMTRGIQNDFRFEKVGAGGYENVGVSIVRYDRDYNWVAVDQHAKVPFAPYRP